MHKPLTSKKKAQALATALFFLGLAILAFLNSWWPAIMLVVGVPLAFRQLLLGRTYDMCLSLLVFVGTFVTVQFDIAWRIFLPILFTIGAIYVLFREFTESTKEDETEREEDLQHELEEKKKKD